MKKKPEPKLTNARIPCDVEEGHCACGAFHTMAETIWRRRQRAAIDLAVEIENWRRAYYSDIQEKTATQAWVAAHLLRLIFDQPLSFSETGCTVIGDVVRRMTNSVSNGDGFGTAKAKAKWAALAKRVIEADVWISK